MSEIAENIKKTFENILKIYEETASLILDTDVIMDRYEYMPFRGSWMEVEYSRSLEYPRYWFAQAVVRYYKSEKDSKLANAVGVLFLDGNMDAIEPIVASASMRCKLNEEGEISPFGVLRNAWFFQAGNRSLGEPHEFGEIKEVEKGKIRGIALEEVKNHEDLEKLIVEPLIAME